MLLRRVCLLAVVAWDLLGFAAPLLHAEAGCLEVVITVYSPISIAKDTELHVRFDTDGIVREVRRYLWDAPDPRFARPEDWKLVPRGVTTVETIPGGYREITVNVDGTVVRDASYVIGPNGGVVGSGDEAGLEAHPRDAVGSYTLVLNEADTVIFDRVGETLLSMFVVPTGVKQIYDWDVPNYLYTMTHERSGREWTAYAEYDEETDTITAQLPVYDPPPYDWKYEITNAAALLDQSFVPVAIILNPYFVGLPTGEYLMPLITSRGVTR